MVQSKTKTKEFTKINKTIKATSISKKNLFLTCTLAITSKISEWLVNKKIDILNNKIISIKVQEDAYHLIFKKLQGEMSAAIEMSDFEEIEKQVLALYQIFLKKVENNELLKLEIDGWNSMLVLINHSNYLLFLTTFAVTVTWIYENFSQKIIDTWIVNMNGTVFLK